MPEIGETLREARMRRRIDMSEVESATKIRAKYLRALENEEWDLLPGPTFVKSFLRTYGEYLGLDARTIVEEYKQRYERPSGSDLTPFSTGLGGQRPRRRPRASIGPGVVIIVGVAALVGALYLLGTWGNDKGGETQSTARRHPTRTPSGAAKHNRAAARPKRVALKLVPTGDVYVCLVDAANKPVVDQVTLHAGEATRTFHSKLFRVTFGTSNVRMRINGRSYPVAVSAEPVGYELRPGRKPRRLATAQLPLCQ